MVGKYPCACSCGLIVGYQGQYCRTCLPVEKKNPPSVHNIKKTKEKLEVKAAAAVADLEVPALTTQQMEDTTTKALLVFKEKLIKVRKMNKGKVIVASIAVVGEGLHSSGRNCGKTIIQEMQQASLWSVDGMATALPSQDGSKQECTCDGTNKARPRVCEYEKGI